MSAVAPTETAPTWGKRGIGPGRVLPDDPPGWALLLVAVKIGLGIGLLIGLGDDDLSTVGSIVQVASYLVVALAIALQRRIGLVLSSAFVGYSLAAGIAVFGVRSDRVVVLASSALLAVALLANAMRPRPRRSKPTKNLVAMAVCGALLGTVLAPLVSVSAVDQLDSTPSGVDRTSSVAFSPTDFIPADAKAELLSSAALDDNVDIDCVLTELYRSVGLVRLMSWSGRDLTPDERAEVAGFADGCET